MFPGDRKRTGSADQDGVSVFDLAPTDIWVFDEVDEIELAPGDTAALDKAALLLFEGYELVPDLEEDESKSGSWCGHFILRALFAGGLYPDVRPIARSIGEAELLQGAAPIQFGAINPASRPSNRG
jgi:hypothetical protein